jgi:N-acetylated-alpha-linked acidic dipeptidase
MLEVASILGKLRAQGWQPLRDIVFASFDAGAYNMIGSTEFVEDRLEELRDRAVAYINVDSGVSGSKFKASGSPLFRRPLTRVLDRVADPVRNKTLKDIWAEDGFRMQDFSYDGDYVAFQSLAGTTSVNIGFEGERYPQHSCYETLEWMEQHGDPSLNYHKILAQIWVLLVLELSQNRLLPLGTVDYANDFDNNVKKLNTDVAYAAVEFQRSGAPVDFVPGRDAAVNLAPLRDASRALSAAARVADGWEAWWIGQVYGSGAVETNALARARRAHNARVTALDTDLLDVERPGNKGGGHGLPGREQYRHVVMGPRAWRAGEGAPGGSWFPLVRDAVDRGDWKAVQGAVVKTARIVKAAAEKLGHVS